VKRPAAPKLERAVQVNEFFDTWAGGDCRKGIWGGVWVFWGGGGVWGGGVGFWGVFVVDVKKGFCRPNKKDLFPMSFTGRSSLRGRKEGEKAFDVKGRHRESEIPLIRVGGLSLSKP